MKIAFSLSESGKRRLLETLAQSLNDRTLDTILAAWLSDIKFAEHDPLEAYIEIGSQYTFNKRPVTLTFRGGEVLTEEVLTED